MLRLLKLAADHDCEEALGVYVLGLMTESKPINIDAIEVKFNQHHPSLPDVPCYQHDINQYDALVV